MLRKLPGLIWTLGLLTVLARRFLPPDALRSVIEKARGAIDEQAPLPTPVAASGAADLHTPMPVA